MVDARPRVIFVADGKEITHRQMEALAMLNDKGSMKKAAAALGISTPVLHKYVHEAEEKADEGLVITTSRGSKLTSAGLKLLRKFGEYELRLKDDDHLRIAGTVVSQRCLLTAASELSASGRNCIITISTDETNLRLVKEGRLDCVAFDDALIAMDNYAEGEIAEIGSDMLMHRDNGPRHARLAFGAQRIAFRHLDEEEIPHEVVRTIFEPTMVDRTELSYFVNRSLVRTGVVNAAGAKDQAWSLHSIAALKCTEHEDLSTFLEEAQEAWVYRKG
jgi:molybdenum-dependent DNA-binding transcriptional regulator ModE